MTILLDAKDWQQVQDSLEKADAGLKQVLRRGRTWGDEVREGGRYQAGTLVKFKTKRELQANIERVRACALILSDMLGMAPFFWERVMTEPFLDPLNRQRGFLEALDLLDKPKL